MSYRIFVSYSTRDLEYVNQIKEALKGLPDVSLFIAEYSLNPGQSLSKDVLKKINDCDLFLLLWSEEAKSSEWVPMEIGAAKAKTKRILPVILQSNLNLPGFIKDLKYLDIHSPKMNPIMWLRNHILDKSQRKKQTDNLVLLGLGGFLLWALTSGE